MKYRVYQNRTEFATTVEADSEKEALELSKKVDYWDEYECNEDNIFYDTVCLEPKKYLTKDEQIEMARDMLNRYYELCSEIDKDGVMSSSDLVLYSDDLERYWAGEIEDEDLEERVEQLRLFTGLTNN